MKRNSKDYLIYVSWVILVIALITQPSALSLPVSLSVLHMFMLVLSGKLVKRNNKIPANIVAGVGVVFLILSIITAILAVVNPQATMLTYVLIAAAIYMLIAPYFGVKFTMKRGKR